MVRRQQNDLVYKTLLCGEGMVVVWIWEFRERMGDIEALYLVAMGPGHGQVETLDP